MKNLKRFTLLIVFCIIIFSACQSRSDNNDKKLINGLSNKSLNVTSDKNQLGSNGADASRFYRNVSSINFDELTFTPWDTQKHALTKEKKQAKKPYTIMVYMNGSDLESENGAATDDLVEMLDSGVSSNNVNIVLFTGGTNRWQNNVIPENDCVIWEVSDGRIHKTTSIGLVNMGDPGTLSSFIDFTMENFPAEKYGLVLWDHGGGSIAGYGHDEKFNNSNLTLLDMNYAFERSKLSQTKLEFLGFDSCLMASIEMAVIASDYANYLIASEDLEPGGGWDYSFLSMLNHNPYATGAELGVTLTDYFMDCYGVNSEEILTMSVIDLSNIHLVMESLGTLMNKCSYSLLTDKESSFKTLAKKRSGTKTFGEGSPRDNECDMVDIGDMVNKLSDLYPAETANIVSELEKCVVYNRNNSDVNLSGLSAYYIYGGKGIGDFTLNTYASLYMDEKYTSYLNNFYSLLDNDNAAKSNSRYRSNTQKENDDDDALMTAGDLISSELTVWKPIDDKPGYFIMTGILSGINTQPDEVLLTIKSTLWPRINGENVCMYKIGSSNKNLMYAIPSFVNGRDCDIIVSLSEKYPDGKILGIRQEDGVIIQKGLDNINDGDKISFYYQERYFGDNSDDDNINWYKGKEFTVNGEFKLEWSKNNYDNAQYYLRLIDIRNNESFADTNTD